MLVAAETVPEVVATAEALLGVPRVEEALAKVALGVEAWLAAPASGAEVTAERVVAAEGVAEATEGGCRGTSAGRHLLPTARSPRAVQS